MRKDFLDVKSLDLLFENFKNPLYPHKERFPTRGGYKSLGYENPVASVHPEGIKNFTDYAPYEYVHFVYLAGKGVTFQPQFSEFPFADLCNRFRSLIPLCRMVFALRFPDLQLNEVTFRILRYPPVKGCIKSAPPHFDFSFLTMQIWDTVWSGAETKIFPGVPGGTEEVPAMMHAGKTALVVDRYALVAFMNPHPSTPIQNKHHPTLKHYLDYILPLTQGDNKMYGYDSLKGDN